MKGIEKIIEKNPELMEVNDSKFNINNTNKDYKIEKPTVVEIPFVPYNSQGGDPNGYRK